MSVPPLRLCLVDMNNGVANEAVRCFRRQIETFAARARAANPGLQTPIVHIQPRNLGEVPPRDLDLVISSGGPGSPHDGYDEPWCDGYRAFLDHVVERNQSAPTQAPQVFAVCHSFEVCTLHFGVARMRKRPTLKFGLMPAYMTEHGMQSELFKPFGDRLFAFEHRSWEAVDLDEKRLASLGGALLARESREGRTDKGEALLSFQFAPGVVGTQFHPEADRPGVIAWIRRPEMTEAVKSAYGEQLYERMIKSLGDPTRLAKTFAVLIPGWLTRRFNQIAEVRGLRPLPMPEEDFRQFDEAGEQPSA